MIRCATRAAVAVLCVSSLCLGGEQWLNYRFTPAVSDEIGNPGRTSAELKPAVPEGLTEHPQPVADKAFYGRMFGNRFIMLDKAEPAAKDYRALWFDANNNGKLETGERIDLGKARSGPERGALISIAFPSPDGDVTEHFAVEPYVRGDQAWLSATSACYYSGRVKFGEKALRVALLDYNCNGVFNDPTALKKTGDRILIDYNNDGRFENYYQNEAEVAYISKQIWANGAYWDLAVAPDGASITVTPSQAATGILDVDEGAVTLTVESEDGRYTLHRKSSKEVLRLPLGSYRVVAVAIPPNTGYGGNMTQWYGQGSKGVVFEIAADATAQLKVAAPFTMKAVASKPRDGNVEFSLALIGEDGLSYNIPQTRQPPQLLLKAKEGNWQKRYAFAFG